MAHDRDQARPRPVGRPARRVPGAAGRRQDADPRRHGRHQGHRRAPRQHDRRVRAASSRPRAPTASSSSCRASPTPRPSASSSARPASSTSCRSARPRRPRASRSTSSSTRPLFSGDQVSSATVGTDQNGRPAVDFVLKPTAPDLFSDYTAEPRRQLLRDRPRRHGRVGAGHPERRSRTARSRSRRRARRLQRQGRRPTS